MKKRALERIKESSHYRRPFELEAGEETYKLACKAPLGQNDEYISSLLLMTEYAKDEDVEKQTALMWKLMVAVIVEETPEGDKPFFKNVKEVHETPSLVLVHLIAEINSFFNPATEEDIAKTQRGK